MGRVCLDAVDFLQALPFISPGLRGPSKEVWLSNEQDGKVDVIVVVADI